MLDKIRKLWNDRPTPAKDAIQELVAKALAAVFVASFLGSLLAIKGCG
jgi:hypothetical protein